MMQCFSSYPVHRWTGFFLMNVGELGNFISYAFAPASVVAPLGTVRNAGLDISGLLTMPFFSLLLSPIVRLRLSCWENIFARYLRAEEMKYMLNHY